MLLYSLDEFGDFEGIKQENKPVFIAGLIYDDKNNDNEIANERKRIEAYYKAVIDEVKTEDEDFQYPSALHANWDMQRNSTIVKPVKPLSFICYSKKRCRKNEVTTGQS